jgi:hypothetical protein
MIRAGGIGSYVPYQPSDDQLRGEAIVLPTDSLSQGYLEEDAEYREETFPSSGK